MDIDIEGGAFKKIHQLINEKYLPYHKGESFTADKIWYYFNFHKRTYPTESGYTAAQIREELDKVLYYKTKTKTKPDLVKSGNEYRVINREFKIVKPGQTSSRFDLRWPVGADGSTFRFDESIIITKGDVMGLGGEGNKGKSVFALDLVVANMDIHKVTLVLSENVQRLDERLSHFTWADIHKPDGDWKFEVIEARGMDEFIDIARDRRDNLIVFDWLNVTKDAYRVSEFYLELSAVLGDGVALAIQQKRSYKDWVVGGEAALDFCSVFLLLQAGKIRVAKVKVPGYYDPNEKLYRFSIVDNGSRFSGIAEIYDCPQCHGKKIYQGTQCGRCYGNGYLDVLDPD